MQLDKKQVIEFLKQGGDDAQVEAAQRDLPDEVDTDYHGGLLAQHGVSVVDLMAKFAGSSGT